MKRILKLQQLEREAEFHDLAGSSSSLILCSSAANNT